MGSTKKNTVYPIKISLASELSGKGIISSIRISPDESTGKGGSRVWNVKLKTVFGDWLELTTSYRNTNNNKPKRYAAISKAKEELKKYGVLGQQKVSVEP